MKKTITTLCLTFWLITPLFSQTFNGKLGYGVSPLGHPSDFSQFGPFLVEVSNTCNGGVVMANGSWRDNISNSGNIPTLQKTVAQLQPTPYNYTDLLVFGWATYPTLYLNTNSDPTNNWTNSDMRNLFLQTLINTADSLSPAYMFIGNEVNFYLTQDSSDYANWSSFYSMAYDSIKSYSPTTKVGTIFNYEHLSGQGVNTGWNTPHWNALLDMDTSKIDILGLTVYPFFNSINANSVSNNYMDTLFAQIGTIPLAITETGWPGDSLYGNWNASPQEQVDWVNKLFNILNGRNVEVVNWLFLNYMMDNSLSSESLIFKSVALRDSLGNDRPALPIWLSNCNTSSTFENETTSNKVHLFPNPSSNKLTVQIDDFKNKYYQLKIYDMFGRQVKQYEIRNEITEITNGSLPEGIYLYHLTNNLQIINTGKIIIQK